MELATPTGHRVVSVDVECVANGKGHNDRCVARVAVVGMPPAGHPLHRADQSPAKVDHMLHVLLDEVVAPPEGTKIVSFLTPLTGMTEAHFSTAKPLAEVQAALLTLLGPDVILVGQGIQGDIDWLQLQAGRDYATAVDLAEIFKAYNPRYANFSFFTLRHEATVLLGPGTRASTEEHCPVDDAQASIRLYHRYVVERPGELEAAKRRLLAVRSAPSLAKSLGYVMDGVCMAKFMPDRCICGQPTGKKAAQ